MNIKKIISVGLATSTLLCASDIYYLDEVVTVATKTKSQISDLPMQVSVITNEEINNSGASNVGEILNSEGSIYLQVTGNNGAMMSVRGMAHSDTLYLIDGRRVNGEFSKTYELDRIPASMIERIEIVKGSSSLLYGSDAMGGVINIITKKPKESFGGDIVLTHGKNKNGTDLFVHGLEGKTSYRLYASYLKRDALTKKQNTDVKVMQAGAETSPSLLVGGGNWATLRANLNDSYNVNRDYQDNLELKNIGAGLTQYVNDYFKIDFDISYMKEDKNGEYISNMYETAYIQGGNTIKSKYIPTEQFDDNKRIVIGSGLTYTPNDNLDIKYNISYSKYDKDRKVYTTLWKELGYASKEASLSSINKTTIKHINNDLLTTYSISEDNRVLFGLDYRITDVKSTAFNVADRKYKGLFAQHEYMPFDKLNLVYGARYDKDTVGESNTSVSFGGTYDIASNTKLKANYSQGFRNPEDKELYVDQTNPNGKKMLGTSVIDVTAGKNTALELKPETSETVEFGLITKGDIWSLDISTFKTEIKDRISQFSTATYNSFKNISKSEIKGYEAGFTISPVDDFIAKITYSDIKAKNKTDNLKLIYTPKNLASLTLSYFPIQNLELRSITKYVGKQINDIDETLGGFSVTNFKVIYSDAFKDTDLFAGIDNLFRKTIADDLGMIEKSNYYVGIKYKF
ncbi:MAG: TonB-dependent receptor [Arcobacter butzleri]|nr:TonB-dependent receptor [Aliarcobacter butzleri]